MSVPREQRLISSPSPSGSAILYPLDPGVCCNAGRRSSSSSIHDVFRGAGGVPVGMTPDGAAAAEFDSDGVADLVIADAADSAVSVRIADP